MTGPNRFDSQEGIVIHGKAYTRSQVLGIKHECYLALRRSAVPPHTLEKYDSTNSSSAVVISLKNVIVNPSKRRGFVLIASSGVLHQFSVESEAAAAEWIKNLQNLTCFEPLTSRELNYDVVPCGLALSLVPSTALNFHGRCFFVVSDKDICLHRVEDTGQVIVSWPLNAIRSYGINKNVFTLKTGRSTMTGRAEFIFEVLKPLTPFHVYQEVAARFSSSQTPLPTNDEISSPVTGTDDGYENPRVTDPPDAVTQDSDERQVVYRRELPLAHSVTCLLPSKSFQTVFGLDDSVAKVRTLLGSESLITNCGVLLYGPPNSGKSTLANALAMEFEARFVCLDCESLARRFCDGDLESLRRTFDCVLTFQPCVVLIEHIELISIGFKCSELGFTVVQAIADLLDRASSNPMLVIVCSTSRPQSVDDSLLTRLSKRIYVPLPSETTRSNILRILSMPCVGTETFVKGLVLRTSGCSVAQLRKLCSAVERHIGAIDWNSRSCTVEMLQELETVSGNWLSELEADPPHRTHMEAMEASAEYFVKQNTLQDTFLVTLESNPALPGIHVCFLKVTSSGLELLDLDPSHTIVSWSRRTIRGFGTTANLFQLETGRSSSTGAAFFNFQTSEANAIQQMINTRCSNRPNISETYAPMRGYAHVA